MPSNRSHNDEGSSPAAGPYIVVARRYRPQSFAELVGQEHVAAGLTAAIHKARVGHAYLFCGARGTGKTSTARILAKCLNCAAGPTVSPCQTCDACRGITGGDDIDVLEMDGASNRGIEEIRQLRSTVGVRPSRSRFKVYIIDEVHMLTVPAFNALLKTLEEPPEHVKFIFCTTEADKVPITIRSRCQRFDFLPVEENAIRLRLQQIAAAESKEIDEAAIRLIARRAGGSVRDSQSLLEQLLSLEQASIRVDDVHRLLGTADDALVAGVARALAGRDAPAAIAAVERAFAAGVDAGQLAAQLLGYFRDGLMLSLGCSEATLASVSPEHAETLRGVTEPIGRTRLLALLQILDECLVRLRNSLHPQILLEATLVRMAELESLDALRDLIEAARGDAVAHPPPAPEGASPSSPAPSFVEQKKKGEPDDEGAAYQAVGGAREPAPHAVRRDSPAAPLPASSPSAPATARPLAPLSEDRIDEVWRKALQWLNDTTADMAGQAASVRSAGEGRWVVALSEDLVQLCNQGDRREALERAIEQVSGMQVRIEFSAVAVAGAASCEPPPPALTKVRQLRSLQRHPLVQTALELLGGEVTRSEPLATTHRAEPTGVKAGR